MKKNRCDELCKLNNISQKTFARLIGVSQDYADCILKEQVELEPELINRICEVLNVDSDFLLKRNLYHYGNL